ncbi:hypothetical protein CEE34_11425 [Candidatus Aerophobetes bacterium Ae_b3a]|nr:MAG: hypothetical protein CEE34_11425 [Candidatus Aerophobetes bacterium Ae_b3a]
MLPPLRHRSISCGKLPKEKIIFQHFLSWKAFLSQANGPIYFLNLITSPGPLFSCSLYNGLTSLLVILILLLIFPNYTQIKDNLVTPSLDDLENYMVYRRIFSEEAL